MSGNGYGAFIARQAAFNKRAEARSRASVNRWADKLIKAEKDAANRRTCPKCERRTPAADAFCGGCGEPLSPGRDD